MAGEKSIGVLMDLGFTGLEAEVYSYLVGEAPATGYRVAQAIGRPAANVYKALETLQAKGAVIVDEGANRLCRATPVRELLDGLTRAFQERKERASMALGRLGSAPEDTRVYALRSADQVFERCRAMLQRARHIVLIDLFPLPMARLREEIQAAVSRGVIVQVSAYEPVDLPGVELLVHPRGSNVIAGYPGQWLNVVADSRECLLAFLTRDGRGVHQAVWTGSAFLSHVYHAGLGFEMVVTQIRRAVAQDAAIEEVATILKDSRRLFSAEIPGHRELLRQFGETTAPHSELSAPEVQR